MPLSRDTAVTTDFRFREALGVSAAAFAGALPAPNSRCSAAVNRKPCVPVAFRIPRVKLVVRPSGSSTDATQVFMCGTVDGGSSHVTDNGSRHSFFPAPASRQPHSCTLASRSQPCGFRLLSSRYSRTFLSSRRTVSRCRRSHCRCVRPPTAVVSTSPRPVYSNSTSASPPSPYAIRFGCRAPSASASRYS